jgi:hypothetical protein
MFMRSITSFVSSMRMKDAYAVGSMCGKSEMNAFSIISILFRHPFFFHF